MSSSACVTRVYSISARAQKAVASSPCNENSFIAVFSTIFNSVGMAWHSHGSSNANIVQKLKGALQLEHIMWN